MFNRNIIIIIWSSFWINYFAHLMKIKNGIYYLVYNIDYLYFITKNLEFQIVLVILILILELINLLIIIITK